MIAKFLIILLASVIFSCGSSRKAQSEKRLIEIEQRESAYDSMFVVKHNIVFETDRSKKAVEVIHEEYDVETGKIRSRTSYKELSHTDKQKDILSDSTLINVSEDKHFEHVSDSTSTEKIRERKESSIPQQMTKLVWAIIFLLLAIIIFKIARKIGKR